MPDEAAQNKGFKPFVRLHAPLLMAILYKPLISEIAETSAIEAIQPTFDMTLKFVLANFKNKY
jgi:hypothetical protein